MCGQHRCLLVCHAFTIDNHGGNVKECEAKEDPDHELQQLHVANDPESKARNCRFFDFCIHPEQLSAGCSRIGKKIAPRTQTEGFHLNLFYLNLKYLRLFINFSTTGDRILLEFASFFVLLGLLFLWRLLLVLDICGLLRQVGSAPQALK